jgi:sulfiredoxin
MRIAPLPIDQIRRPLPRQNDPAKVASLMESIAATGQQEPIEILEVEGIYYGFSGCHRFEACQQLGQSTVLCCIRRAPRSVLQMHLA